jgi:hypothetical protein
MGSIGVDAKGGFTIEGHCAASCIEERKDAEPAPWGGSG